MAVMLVVDTSASMGFPTEGTSKLRYATIVAAALAYLIVTQGDSVGLMSASGDKLTYLPARGGRAHLRRVLATLDKLRAVGHLASSACDFEGRRFAEAPRAHHRAVRFLRRGGRHAARVEARGPARSRRRR